MPQSQPPLPPVSFGNRYQNLLDGLNSKKLVTSSLKTTKINFCARTVKLLVTLLSLGLIDPYRHVRIGNVMASIFKDCENHADELKNDANKEIVLQVISRLGAQNPKKFGRVCSLYQYAVKGLATGKHIPMLPPLPGTGRTPPPPPPPPPPVNRGLRQRPRNLIPPSNSNPPLNPTPSNSTSGTARRRPLNAAGVDASALTSNPLFRRCQNPEEVADPSQVGVVYNHRRNQIQNLANPVITT